MARNVDEPRANRRWRWAIASYVALALLVLASCGGEPHDASQADRSTTRTVEPRSINADPLHPIVEIITNQGTIRIKLDGVYAPGTVRNFLNYANDGFYANTLFHYVVPNKMIVGGGYSVDGKPKPSQATLRNEAHNGLKNTRGTIAMARDPAAGIDSATSQFFINLVDSPAFDHRGEESQEYGYCVFGKVVEGLEVADSISQSSTRDQGGDLARMPVPPVVVKSIRVLE